MMDILAVTVTQREGYVEWALNTGIAEDFIETNERDKMIEKYGKAWSYYKGLYGRT